MVSFWKPFFIWENGVSHLSTETAKEVVRRRLDHGINFSCIFYIDPVYVPPGRGKNDTEGEVLFVPLDIGRDFFCNSAIRRILPASGKISVGEDGRRIQRKKSATAGRSNPRFISDWEGSKPDAA